MLACGILLGWSVLSYSFQRNHTWNSKSNKTMFTSAKQIRIAKVPRFVTKWYSFCRARLATIQKQNWRDDPYTFVDNISSAAMFPQLWRTPLNFRKLTLSWGETLSLETCYLFTGQNLAIINRNVLVHVSPGASCARFCVTEFLFMVYILLLEQQLLF